MHDYAEETRRIYVAQHERIASDRRSMERFIEMFSCEYFGFDPQYFKGKKVLNAGCGSTAKLEIALYGMGARDIHAFDLGEDFAPIATRSLRNFGVPESAVSFKSGSVLAIPYEDCAFDFVACHGVLIHVNNVDEARRGFDELARVTKPGGYLYAVFGIIGGLFEDAILPAARAYYHGNPEFRKFIDGVKPSDFHRLIDIVEDGLRRHEGDSRDLSPLKAMFDEDLCVTIQNVLQAPVNLAINEDMIREMYAENRFNDLRRLRRYVRRPNIRRFFAPLHYQRDDPIVCQFYGSGSLEFIGRKAER